jgi:hypothetical protein
MIFGRSDSPYIDSRVACPREVISAGDWGLDLDETVISQMSRLRSVVR